MSRETGLQLAEAFPGADIYHVYGLTEAGPRVSYLPPELFRKYPDCVGIPLRSVTLQIRRPDGRCAGAGEEGLLYVRGGSVMAGYYQEPEKTREVLREGWLCTGDMAVITDVGLLKIKGRQDNLIIKAGMNIYPQEIEEALKADPRVREALAYGYRTAGGTHIGLKLAGDLASAEEAWELCLKRLPPFQRPVRIELVSELAKNGSGKVNRTAAVPEQEEREERRRQKCGLE